jgi:hypothetical protein
MFSRDQAPAPLVGAGTFMWFASREEAAAFVGERVPDMLLDPAEPDYARLQSATREIADTFAREEVAAADAAVQLTAVWMGAASFEWLGDLDDLLTGSGPFPTRLRADFFARERDADQEGPVGEADAEDFLAFVRRTT